MLVAPRLVAEDSGVGAVAAHQNYKQVPNTASTLASTSLSCHSSLLRDRARLKWRRRDFDVAVHSGPVAEPPVVEVPLWADGVTETDLTHTTVVTRRLIITLNAPSIVTDRGTGRAIRRFNTFRPAGSRRALGVTLGVTLGVGRSIGISDAVVVHRVPDRGNNNIRVIRVIRVASILRSAHVITAASGRKCGKHGE